MNWVLVRHAACLLALASLFSARAHAQYSAAYDQQPSQVAQQMFQAAFAAECEVLQQSNPGISACGIDQLRGNSTLQGWGLTTPVAMLESVTRYNPAPLTQILGRYGPTATFFVFAHEVGHHFDVQFQGAATPWGNIVYPPMQGVPLAFSYSWTRELRADAWGGCAVKRTGNQIAAVNALQAITANIEFNPDVPPVQYAILAINAGYNAC